ncbi:MAG: SpaA isopeptide-forming pilin-related protein [Peptococcaceae bacterium]|nr:SpaA isopeptide-forming pilin-related protein [Peptococcaceae bacterium]
MRKRLLGIALVAVMVLSFTPLAALAANPGEGNIPIPPCYEYDSYGEATSNPSSLEEGQIWVNKNVSDVIDDISEAGDRLGTFEVTLYAWGATFIDVDGVEQKPLYDDAVDKYITITDTIGDQFEYNNDAVYSVGNFSVVGGVATWVVSQDDILSGIESCTFTVSLKNGWESETEYYTNNGASASFKPLKGNPYYWITEKVETVTLEIDDVNWNNGNGTLHGINSIRITDKDLGLVMHKSSPSSDNFLVTGTGVPSRTFTFDSTRTNHDFVATEFDDNGKAIIPYDVYNLSSATDGTWGILWNRGGGNNKTYYIWFMGLEEPGVITIYEVKTPGNGGNQGIPGSRYTYYHEYHHRSGFNWQSDDSILDDLPNKGMISLTCKSYDFEFMKIDGNQYAGGTTVPLPGAAFSIYKLADNNPVLIDVTTAGTPYATETSDSTGLIKFSLEDGSYMLVELAAPTDYILPTGQWFLDVDRTRTGPDEFIVEISYVDDANGIWPPAVIVGDPYMFLNFRNYDLPATGSTGTAIFIGLGSLLMIGGTAVLSIFQRRYRKEVIREVA